MDVVARNVYNTFSCFMYSKTGGISVSPQSDTSMASIKGKRFSGRMLPTLFWGSTKPNVCRRFEALFDIFLKGVAITVTISGRVIASNCDWIKSCF